MTELHTSITNSMEAFRIVGSDRYHIAGQFTSTALTTVAPAINLIHFMPYVSPKTVTVDRIAFNVTTRSATVGAVARVGIYNADQSTLFPTSLVVDGGEYNVSTTGGTTGIKTSTISVTLLANTLYQFAYICGTGNPTISGVPLANQYSMYGTDGAFANSVGTFMTETFTYAALPDPYPTTPNIAGSGSIFPAVAIRLV